ncbi:hypothetical protein O181_007229 [Austropuccinia psidii MF-1]|uniref:C2H2-type domain-containing protein n=1 Tax=Austropuccinia psidii MF-1 TaxID=1389203 RepID=A0A9Q3GHN8_9BASI|nr:hypothetical protein [Austropuccinia psidii MF-1]
MSDEQYIDFENLDDETSSFLRDFLVSPPESLTYTHTNDLFTTSFLNNELVSNFSDGQTPSSVIVDGFQPTLTRVRQDDFHFTGTPQNLPRLEDMPSFDGTDALYSNQSTNMNVPLSSSQSSIAIPFPNSFPQYFEGLLTTQPTTESFDLNLGSPFSWDFSQNTTGGENIDIDQRYKEHDRLSSQNSFAYFHGNKAPHNWAQFGTLADAAGPSSMASFESFPQSYENLINFDSSHQGPFQAQEGSFEVGSSKSTAPFESGGSATHDQCLPFVSNTGLRWDTRSFEKIGSNQFEGTICPNDPNSFLDLTAPAAPLCENTESFQRATVTFPDTFRSTNHQTNFREEETTPRDSFSLKGKRKAEDGDVDSESLGLAAPSTTASETKKKLANSDKSLQSRKRRRKDECKEPVTYTCSICNTGKIIKRKANFERHMLTHLPKSQRTKYKCRLEGCPKEYYYYHDIQKHEKTHPELFK